MNPRFAAFCPGTDANIWTAGREAVGRHLGKGAARGYQALNSAAAMLGLRPASGRCCLGKTLRKWQCFVLSRRDRFLL